MIHPQKVAVLDIGSFSFKCAAVHRQRSTLRTASCESVIATVSIVLCQSAVSSTLSAIGLCCIIVHVYVPFCRYLESMISTCVVMTTSVISLVGKQKINFLERQYVLWRRDLSPNVNCCQRSLQGWLVVLSKDLVCPDFVRGTKY